MLSIHYFWSHFRAFSGGTNNGEIEASLSAIRGRWEGPINWRMELLDFRKILAISWEIDRLARRSSFRTLIAAKDTLILEPVARRVQS